ncbi:MAG: hypothetical protein KDK70_04225 [Myxococcales bacterium]|nr:hypothetical protein [Myxococcales bacterium]
MTFASTLRISLWTRTRLWTWTLAPLALSACFNPSPTPAIETDTEGGCSPGATQPCTCADGTMSTQTCDADGSLGACVCVDPTTSVTDTDPTIGPDTADTGTTGEPECLEDGDCAALAGECEVATCDAGACAVANAEAGTACGDATELPCDLPDSCDGRGACLDNVIPDGAICPDCDADVCTCNTGACEPCNTFAPTNEFLTPRAIDGWELTGGWGLHVRAPQSYGLSGTPFGGQVLGTDGNRVAPYPGAEVEASYARTRPTTLPATLEFLSWHVDEGGVPGVGPVPYDNKRVRVSTDGGTTWTSLADCADAMLPAAPFCGLRLDQRPPGDWDQVSLPVPPALVGQLAIVELSYQSFDDCCGAEQGWYVDALEFATECACVFDQACEAFGQECGPAVCGGAGACEPMPEPADAPCGDATSSACNGADRCNGNGQCLPLEAPSLVTGCADCPSGICSVCEAGSCSDCAVGINDFAGPVGLQGWTIESLVPGEPAGWGLYSVIPRNQQGMVQPSVLSTAPVLGVDGNRLAPYPGAHVESSRITSPLDTLPATLTFDSWHMDEGGAGGTMYDTKIIEVSVDGGATWNVLVDCGTEDPGMPIHPFCALEGGPRAVDDWDPIAIGLGPFGGMSGRIRLTYSTQDSCCDFERGWYIDNLNFAQFCG